ncbi:hypothetical protein FOL47_009062 [Perkinsus chesapeaki]|uniref:Chitinase n=1 Tax=Perkinsus chesapeaki TaxID=330153 RepID=A0A7J6MSY9_PERCH|nr:hypothetical protein FOL47_009062 [Perkinsus chesapeaki]
MLNIVYIISVYAVAFAGPLKFYKGISFPWAIKEGPICSNSTLCPQSHGYTWESYFNKLLTIGVNNFLFGGYVLKNDRIVRDMDFYPPWNETSYSALKKRVKTKGGSILARLGVNYDKAFHNATFIESVRNFTKKYPVDGFMLDTLNAYPSMKVLQQPLRALKGMNYTAALSICDYLLDDLLPALQENSDWQITACVPRYLILRFATPYWQEVNGSGLAKAADINFVVLFPYRDNESSVFNTDNFAKKTIHEAGLAGAKPEGIVLQVPVQAGREAAGYSEMIYDYGADPMGNGSVKIDPSASATLYFFSQRRAIDKIALGNKSHLHGIALEGGTVFAQDLYPWDKASLCYALASKMKASSFP